MKTKVWIGVIAGVLVLCLGLSLYFFAGQKEMSNARILSGGELLREVALFVDQTFTVESEKGVNVVSVRDGKIAVTEADCPDHYCMEMGWKNGGTPIVCLPNGLVIEFFDDGGVDGAVG